jgi:hypothetical protein
MGTSPSAAGTAVLLLLVLAPPRGAEGALCTLIGVAPEATFSCPSASAGSACVAAGFDATGCPGGPRNTDIIQFEGSGYAIRADGNIHGQGPSARLVVDGPSFHCRVADGCELVTLGHSTATPRSSPGIYQGLIVDGGGRVTLQGQYLDPADGAWRDTRPSHFLRVGRLEPCGAGGSCDSDAGRNTMRLAWAAGEAGSDARPIAELLAAARPDDLVCFRDADPDDAWAPADHPFCYRILAVAGDPLGTSYLEYDVRQGAIERSGWGLARRGLARCTVLDAQRCEDGTPCSEDATCAGVGAGRCLGAPLGVGDAVTVALARNASCASLFDADHRGEALHFVRVGGSEPGGGDPFKIVRSRRLERGTDDWAELRVFPAFDRPVALGEELLLDYGVQPGDPFWILRPVRVTDARLAALPAPIASPLLEDQAANVAVVDGTLSATAAHFDRLYNTMLGVEGHYGTIQDVWFSDTTCRSQSGSCAAIGTQNNTGSGASFTLDTVAMTGGPSQRCQNGVEDCGKGTHSNGVGDDVVVIREMGARHLGDDCVASHDTTMTYDIRHLHCAGLADDAGSAECIEFDGTVRVDGLICADLRSDFDDVISFPEPTASGWVHDVLVFGGRPDTGIFGGRFEDQVRFEDVVLLGLEFTVMPKRLVPLEVDRFWIQDVDGSAGLRLVSEANRVVRNGAFVRIHDTSPAAALSATPAREAAAVLSNVAFVDVDGSPAVAHATLARSTGPTGQVIAAVYEHLAFVATRRWEAGGLSRLFGFESTGGAGNHVLHRNYLFAAPFLAGGTSAAWETGAEGWTETAEGDFCFWTNAPDHDAEIGAVLDAMEAAGKGRRIRDQEPDFPGAAGYWPRVDTPKWSVCGHAGVKRGVQAPGVPYDWSLSKIRGVSLKMDGSLGQRPTCGPWARCTECANGIDDDADGLVDLADPGCAAPSDLSEHHPDRHCDDGVDNDADGFVDLADPGCVSPSGGLENPHCDDRIDQDGDGRIDFADPDCTPTRVYWENPLPPCGLGGELALVVWLLGRRRWRREP